jgi:iron complex transport system permease protein
MRTLFWLLLLLTLVAACMVGGLLIGSFQTDFPALMKALFHYNAENPSHYAIVHLRLPRLMLAFLTGGALALSGYLMQAMVNNPLADPYLLGTASGASLGANLVLAGFLPLTLIGIYMPSVLAFAGAVAVTLLVVGISYQQGRIVPSQMLLGGVAISSLLTAIISLLSFLSGSESELRSLVFWTMGGFERAQWSDLPVLALFLAIATVLVTFLHKQLAILLLGESRAHHLGVNLSRLRWIILLTASLLTSLAVALSGSIGFIGLMVPHMVRALFGVTFTHNALFTVLLGGLFTLACDLISRLLVPPAGLPVGILTAFLGIPFFLYLLRKKNYRFG